MSSRPWTRFNCYEILGVPPTASPAEIRSAYHIRSKQAHPDAGGSHEAQVKINLAYETLEDPVLRQAHDQFWSAQRPSPTASPYRARAAPGTVPRQPPPPRPQPSPSAFDALYRRVQSEIDVRAQQMRARRSEAVATREGQYERKVADARATRTMFLWAALLVTALAAVFSTSGATWPWIVSAAMWLVFANSSSGVHLGRARVSPTDSRWRDKARAAAEADVDAENSTLLNALRQHLTSVASLQELLQRSSGFDDSEEQVARRIAGTLFLMGYRPTSFDREGRMLSFTDGEESILVRYRHRAGIATNVTYVRRMVEAMRARGVTRGYLFCTPGLSGNGAELARANRIKWYALETMNSWITQTYQASYDGPKGDILSHLPGLMTFLAQISIPISQSTSRPYRRYRRYY